MAWLLAFLVLAVYLKVTFSLGYINLPSPCGEREGGWNCPDHLFCDPKIQECIDPCDTHPGCGKEAYCFPENHAAKCICNAGTAGDPYKECINSTLGLLEAGLFSLEGFFTVGKGAPTNKNVNKPDTLP